MSFFKVLRDKFYSQHMKGWKTVWTNEKFGPVWITIILIQMDISSLILIIVAPYLLQVPFLPQLLLSVEL